MAGEQGSEGSKDLTAWLVANDAKTRARRSTRLRDLLDILPVPSEGLSFLGGDSIRNLFRRGQALLPRRLELGCRAAVSGICREGTGGATLCGGLGKGEEGPIGSSAGKGPRRQSAVQTRVAHVPRTGQSEELARPLSPAGTPDIAYGSNQRGGRPRHRGARERRETRGPGDGKNCETPIW